MARQTKRNTIAALLQQNPAISAIEIADAVGISRQAVYQHIATLDVKLVKQSIRPRRSRRSSGTVAPDRIDRTYIQQVLQAMSFQEPVAPNAVYQCLSWAYKRIGDMEENLSRIARDAQNCIDDQ